METSRLPAEWRHPDGSLDAEGWPLVNDTGFWSRVIGSNKDVRASAVTGKVVAALEGEPPRRTVRIVTDDGRRVTVVNPGAFIVEYRSKSSNTTLDGFTVNAVGSIKETADGPTMVVFNLWVRGTLGEPLVDAPQLRWVHAPDGRGIPVNATYDDGGRAAHYTERRAGYSAPLNRPLRPNEPAWFGPVHRRDTREIPPDASPDGRYHPAIGFLEQEVFRMEYGDWVWLSVHRSDPSSRPSADATGSNPNRDDPTHAPPPAAAGASRVGISR